MSAGEQVDTCTLPTPLLQTSPTLKEAIASIAWKQVSKWPRKQDLQAQLACALAYLLTCLLVYQEVVAA